MLSNCVIIGDIKKSREIDDWPAVFSELDQILKRVNEEFSRDILVDFGPTIGDEFQGALINPQNVYAIYTSVRNELPVQFYCGIGVGEVERPLDRDIGMRGDAFYRARSALELCKKKKRNLLVKSSDAEGRIDRTINTLQHFIEVLENSWTKRQCEVASYYRVHPDFIYEQLGKHFTTSPQSVSQILKAANWEIITEGEIMVKELLEYIGSEGAVDGDKANML